MMELDKQIRLRKVTEDDCDLLFGWANDPLTRKNSFNSKLIKYEEHIDWFKKAISDPSICIYIFEVDSKVVSKSDYSQEEIYVPIGQIRFKIDDELKSAEIGYSIDAQYRGYGFGKKLLNYAEKKFIHEHPQVERLTAKVKNSNEVSEKAFIGNSYFCEYKCFEKRVSCCEI